MDSEPLNILTVRNARKSYDKREPILQGLNMNVKHSQIYCLLGASGCGKSTLLNLVVGLMDLESGTIETTLTSRQQVGYMTQETSLYDQFNITETFFYYGTIYGFTRDEIKQKSDYLYKLLDLPAVSTWVQLLSGGQRRRVSLAITLLHNPKLLILDEPTIGVDPLLRQSIWDHLVRLCEQESKTVIITTHYIEEGQQAHTVGYMRRGKLLCEQPPRKLMETYNTDNLEDVFIHLSRDQELERKYAAEEKNKEATNEPGPPVSNKNYPLRLKASSTLSWSKISGEMIKNLIYLKRNISVAAFTLLLPAFSTCIFSFTCGREPVGLNFGVMTHELDSAGFSSCENVARKPKCNMDYLSCMYYDKMLQKPIFNLIEYTDLNEAIDGVRKNKLWGLMYFPRNYSRAVYVFTQDPLQFDEFTYSNKAQFYLDYSNYMLKDFLMNNIIDSHVEMLKEVFVNCSWLPHAASVPMKFEEPIFGDSHLDFTIYFTSPTVIILLFATPLLYGLTIMVEEKKSGASARSIIAGVGIFEVMVSHFIVQITLQVIQLIMVLIIVYGLLKMPFQQPYWTVFFIFLQSLVGMAAAFSIAAVTDSIYISSGIQWGYNMVAMLIGGMLWPIEAIPFTFRILSRMLPTTLPIEAVRSLTLRGSSVSHPVVYTGFISSFCWLFGLFFFVLIYVKLTRGKSYLKV